MRDDIFAGVRLAAKTCLCRFRCSDLHIAFACQIDGCLLVGSSLYTFFSSVLVLIFVSAFVRALFLPDAGVLFPFGVARQSYLRP